MQLRHSAVRFSFCVFMAFVIFFTSVVFQYQKAEATVPFMVSPLLVYMAQSALFGLGLAGAGVLAFTAYKGFNSLLRDIEESFIPSVRSAFESLKARWEAGETEFTKEELEAAGLGEIASGLIKAPGFRSVDYEMPYSGLVLEGSSGVFYRAPYDSTYVAKTEAALNAWLAFFQSWPGWYEDNFDLIVKTEGAYAFTSVTINTAQYYEFCKSPSDVVFPVYQQNLHIVNRFTGAVGTFSWVVLSKPSVTELYLWPTYNFDPNKTIGSSSFRDLDNLNDTYVSLFRDRLADALHAAGLETTFAYSITKEDISVLLRVIADINASLSGFPLVYGGSSVAVVNVPATVTVPSVASPPAYLDDDVLPLIPPWVETLNPADEWVDSIPVPDVGEIDEPIDDPGTITPPKPGEIDFSKLFTGFQVATTKFPFSIPWDLKRVLDSFIVPPVKPELYWRPPLMNEDVLILSVPDWLEPVIQWGRRLQLIAFNVGLIWVARTLGKPEGGAS